MGRKGRQRSGIVIPWERGSAVRTMLRGRTIRLLAVLFAVTLAVIWIFRHDEYKARLRETRSSITRMGNAVSAFRSDQGRCPRSLGELTRLGDAAGPYLRSVPRDGWGRKFHMICPGRRNSDSADIRSMGPDGTWFGMDEID